MLPDIDVRIRNVVKAIEEVILPALPADEKMAIEQAALCLAHLRTIDTQWMHALPAARLNFRNLQWLALQLEPLCSASERQRLTAVGQLDAATLTGYVSLVAAARELGTAIDEVIRASRPDPTDEVEVRRLVFEHSRRQARIERSWFGAMGFEPSEGLTSIEAMLERETAELAALGA